MPRLVTERRVMRMGFHRKLSTVLVIIFERWNGVRP